MAHQSPLHSLHEQAEASFLYYGPESGGAPVVETFGEIEAEYAALRRGCVLLDLPQIGTLRITGSDRIGFLNRMVTQELAGLKPYQTARSFWLNRKGRIDADLRLAHLPAAPGAGGDPLDEEQVLVGVDILNAAAGAASLEAFVIADDVQIVDITDRTHRLSLHGPNSAALLSAVCAEVDGPPIGDLNPSQACRATIGGHRVLIERDDQSGEPGLHLLMDVEHVMAIYNTLVEIGRGDNGNDDAPSHAGTRRGFRLRPGGWHAFNIARIEAGTPVMNIDFGAQNLPGETGVLRDRVSFRKGCYLGQEVVARMDALGHPKQILVSIRIPRQGNEMNESQPATGNQVFAPGDDGQAPGPDAKPIGRVTSSARSPMLGDDIIAFAQVRWGHNAPGTRLCVQTGAGIATGEVGNALGWYQRRE
ncbi:MAG: CAF17-like 4Fe-4S cluster assembly/insertion protein YgfZ [Phycisphaerales bacterium]